MNYGWMWLAKEVATYTNTTFFDILDRSVQEVLGIVMVMQAEADYRKLKGQKTNG